MWTREYNRHVKSVLKSGKPAVAHVKTAEQSTWAGVRTGDVSWGWFVQLRVTPEDAQPFDLQLKMEIPVTIDPLPGQDLQVIYNPNKPTEIIVDPTTVPKTTRDGLVAGLIERERINGGDTSGMEEAAAAYSDPVQAAAAAADAARRNILAARDATMAEQKRQRAELAAQAPAGPARLPGGPQAGTSELNSVIQAQLDHLATLRDSGVLDDAAYQAYRQQLLSTR